MFLNNEAFQIICMANCVWVLLKNVKIGENTMQMFQSKLLLANLTNLPAGNLS